MVRPLRNKGMIFVLSAPSGGGKSSLSHELIKNNSNLRMSTSITTRQPRPGEIDEVDYFFKTREEFQRLIDQNALLEYTKIYNNFYGTPIAFAEEQMAQGADLLFDLDSTGARSLKKQMPDRVTTIFILPPSLKVLAQRLNDRGQDSQETIRMRLEAAKAEIQNAKNYDYVIINGIFKKSAKILDAIVKAQGVRREMQDKLEDFLEDFN